MTTVLAALDAGPAARPVLDAALALGELFGATVEAVHVHDGSSEMPEWVAAGGNVSIRVLDGPVEPALLEAVGDPSIDVAVFGARATPGGRRPVGHTALHVLRATTKPVLLVPPEARTPKQLGRILLPLEGTHESSTPVLERLHPLLAREVDLVVLHVFTEDTVPRALDRPARDLSLWSDEFAARFCPVASRVELRVGPIGHHVAEVSEGAAVDLVVLSWSQDMSPGRAAVIREVLGRSTVPVLLLPIAAVS